MQRVSHARTQKRGVPEEAKIGRTSATFDFLKYVLGARHPNPRTTRNLDFDPLLLHVSAQRFCCRNRVTEPGGPWGAKSAREKYKPSDGTANFGLLRDPSFLAARMGAVTYSFVFESDLKRRGP